MAPTNSFVFENHFHPYVGTLIDALTHRSVRGLLNPALQGISTDFFDAAYHPNPDADPGFVVSGTPKNIDTDDDGPYAVYNRELFLHAPIAIAIHLSRTQRYAEAQRWFHYVFDPTSDGRESLDGDPDAHPELVPIPAPARYWKFLRFRQTPPGGTPRIDELVALLSRTDVPDEQRQQLASAVKSYDQVRRHPFQPHAVARTRIVAYQYFVLMRYLDNLVAWGDSLFRLDTSEAITEATGLYVLANELLGPRPEQVPPRGRRRARSFRELKDAGLGPMGDALVEVENALPFARTGVATGGAGAAGSVGLLGLGRTLYFPVPANDVLLGYWDTVADRLTKIRNCRNIDGIARPLALWAPAIDPGVLSAAVAAGVDVAGAVAGMQAPVAPVRATTWLQKAIELAGDLRTHGGALLAAMEKRDGEALARLRQRHETDTAARTRESRFLAWKEAEDSTEALVASRATAFARYRHFQLLLGRPESDVVAHRDVVLARDALAEKDFDRAHRALVDRYAAPVPQVARPAPRLADDGDPQVQSGAASAGSLDLLPSENAELNVHLPAAQAKQEAAVAIDTVFGVLGMLPNMGVDIMPFGAGGHVEFGGPLLSSVGRTLATAIRGSAEQDTYAATRAAKIAGYQRRDLDLVQQSNQAALELMANGRQILAALVHEQVARHEYELSRTAVDRAGEVDRFLAGKDTNGDLYAWMVTETTRVFAETHRTAVDVARAAEAAVKRELMRPEIDDVSFVRYTIETGHRGLLTGERLHLDLKRLELAYHENNKREFELTTSVSLQQLDPLALLELRATGSCVFRVPEWYYDLSCRGHHMRRIRSVALSLPAVTGPYTTVAATLSLLGSSLRRVPTLAGGRYARADGDDSRFVDRAGAVESTVTSTAVNDPGLFDAAGRDERYLPFEGAGAVSTWRLELPGDLRTFDYGSIADAVLHVRYTARPGVDPAAVTADLTQRFADADAAGLARAVSLRHDFPTEWAGFVAGTRDLTVEVARSWFPYFAQTGQITVTAVERHRLAGDELVRTDPPGVTADRLAELTRALADEGAFRLTLPADDTAMPRERDAEVFLLVRYTIR